MESCGICLVTNSAHNISFFPGKRVLFFELCTSRRHLLRSILCHSASQEVPGQCKLRH